MKFKTFFTCFSLVTLALTCGWIIPATFDSLTRDIGLFEMLLKLVAIVAAMAISIVLVLYGIMKKQYVFVHWLGFSDPVVNKRLSDECFAGFSTQYNFKTWIERHSLYISVNNNKVNVYLPYFKHELDSLVREKAYNLSKVEINKMVEGIDSLEKSRISREKRKQQLDKEWANFEGANND